MPLISILQKNKFIFDLVWFFRGLAGITPEQVNHTFHKKNSSTLIQDYLQKHTVRKLQIGAQCNSINGWLNVDILPKDRQTAYMDATKPFPFNTNSFDFIFSEHMIEHISFKEGEFMLKECYRVLKPGGKIRISTPNLAFLIALYTAPKEQLHQEYVSESVKRYFKSDVPMLDTIVINNFFRDWGHQFIHDYKSLSHLLEKAGFKNSKLCQVGKSNDPVLSDLEKHGLEVSEKFNHLESIIIEAIK